AALAKIELAEMAVAVAQRDGQGLAGVRPAAPDLRQMKFKSIGIVYAYAVFGAGDGIEDWLTPGFHIARNDETGATPVHVDLELDVGENRFVHLVERHGED